VLIDDETQIPVALLEQMKETAVVRGETK
jgi:hypothetical protein